MKIEVERKEYVRETRVYNYVFDDEDLEQINKEIKEYCENPITVTPEEFAKVCNLDEDFERANYKLEYKRGTLYYDYTYSLFDFLREYINDTLWEVDYDVEDCEGGDYYDTVIKSEN